MFAIIEPTSPFTGGPRLDGFFAMVAVSRLSGRLFFLSVMHRGILPVFLAAVFDCFVMIEPTSPFSGAPVRWVWVQCGNPLLLSCGPDAVNGGLVIETTIFVKN